MYHLIESIHVFQYVFKFKVVLYRLTFCLTEPVARLEIDSLTLVEVGGVGMTGGGGVGGGVSPT